MKPVDHVTPALPSKWVRRTDARDRKRDPNKDRQLKRDPKQPLGQDPNGRTHIIDDLA